MSNNQEYLQRVLAHIDTHIKDELTPATLASLAGFSTYHFYRLFIFATGYSIMEYVRNRRLAFAASELSTSRRVIDIAMDYGFETHSGFSKAFRRHFGCTPETYRCHARCTVPPIPSLEVMNKYSIGGVIMEPKIISRPKTKIVGHSIRTRSENNENTKAIPEFWTKYMTDGRMEKLHKEPFVMCHDEYGACFTEDMSTGEFDYVIGVEPREGASIPDGYVAIEIPAATYAVFATPPSDASGFTTAIQGTWGYIFNEWFPTSGYEYAPGAVDYELYGDTCMSETGKVCEIYIPVIKKA